MSSIVGFFDRALSILPSRPPTPSSHGTTSSRSSTSRSERSSFDSATSQTEATSEYSSSISSAEEISKEQFSQRNVDSRWPPDEQLRVQPATRPLHNVNSRDAAPLNSHQRSFLVPSPRCAAVIETLRTPFLDKLVRSSALRLTSSTFTHPSGRPLTTSRSLSTITYSRSRPSSEATESLRSKPSFPRAFPS